jgi:hypothetical protein
MKDYQRQRVYDWEDVVVAARCPGVVPFANSQTYIDGVWLANGWERPPQAAPMPQRKDGVRIASATYGEIKLSLQTPGWVILHELAHALTDDRHGPNFVGMYIDLLERVEQLPRLLTMFTLKQAQIDFNLGVKPLNWVVKR